MEEKTSARKQSLLCNIRNVQQNAYFYYRRYHGGRSQIGHAKTFGDSGLVDTDSEALQGWLLKFEEDSKRLRTSVETFFDWISNKSLPLAAYCAFMSGRLVALDKQPGVCPVGVGEIWRYIFDNIV